MIISPAGFSPSKFESCQSFIPMQRCLWIVPSLLSRSRTAYPQQACVDGFPQLSSPLSAWQTFSPGVPPAEFVTRMLSPSSWVCDIVIPSTAVSASPSRVVKVYLQYDMMCYHPHQSCSPQQSGVGFPQQVPRVERVSQKYFSSRVHPTSGVDKFP